MIDQFANVYSSASNAIGILLKHSLFLHSNARGRTTVLIEGMSVCEDGVIRNTLQSDVTRIVECRAALNSRE